MNLLVILIFTLFGVLWRPWLGGSFNNISRFWKILLLFIAVFFLYFYFFNFSFTFLKTWQLYFILLMFMRFWNHSHGDYFKVNDEGKDEGRVKWLDWMLSKIYGKDNYYNFTGNVTGLIIGYSVYSIPVGIVFKNFLFCFSGLLLAITYGIMGKLYPNGWYTKYAEFIGGGLVFLLFSISLYLYV